MDSKKTSNAGNQRRSTTCPHPSLAKEFILGLPTGNYICAHCGQPLSNILKQQH